VTEPARGAFILLSPLILVFAMFSLRPAQSRDLAVFAFALLGAVMIWKARTDPFSLPRFNRTHTHHLDRHRAGLCVSDVGAA